MTHLILEMVDSSISIVNDRVKIRKAWVDQRMNRPNKDFITPHEYRIPNAAMNEMKLHRPGALAVFVASLPGRDAGTWICRASAVTRHAVTAVVVRPAHLRGHSLCSLQVTCNSNWISRKIYTNEHCRMKNINPLNVTIFALQHEKKQKWTMDMKSDEGRGKMNGDIDDQGKGRERTRREGGKENGWRGQRTGRYGLSRVGRARGRGLEYCRRAGMQRTELCFRVAAPAYCFCFCFHFHFGFSPKDTRNGNGERRMENGEWKEKERATWRVGARMERKGGKREMLLRE